MTKEELIQELKESAEEIEELEGSYGYIFDDIANMVKDSDFVEVIRCKDCIWSNGALKYCSNDHWVNKDETSFCSSGEKKR